jgi:hypothetical protein
MKRKPLSRQRLKQIENVRKGCCAYCSEPLVSANECIKHFILKREYSRRRNGSKRRNNSLSYRLEKGQTKINPAWVEAGKKSVTWMMSNENSFKEIKVGPKPKGMKP